MNEWMIKQSMQYHLLFLSCNFTIIYFRELKKNMLQSKRYLQHSKNRPHTRLPPGGWPPCSPLPPPHPSPLSSEWTPRLGSNGIISCQPHASPDGDVRRSPPPTHTQPSMLSASRWHMWASYSARTCTHTYHTTLFPPCFYISKSNRYLPHFKPAWQNVSHFCILLFSMRSFIQCVIFELWTHTCTQASTLLEFRKTAVGKQALTLVELPQSWRWSENQEEYKWVED